MNINRRTFLKGMGAAVASAAVPSVAVDGMIIESPAWVATKLPQVTNIGLSLMRQLMNGEYCCYGVNRIFLEDGPPFDGEHLTYFVGRVNQLVDTSFMKRIFSDAEVVIRTNKLWYGPCSDLSRPEIENILARSIGTIQENGVKIEIPENGFVQVTWKLDGYKVADYYGDPKAIAAEQMREDELIYTGIVWC